MNEAPRYIMHNSVFITYTLVLASNCVRIGWLVHVLILLRIMVFAIMIFCRVFFLLSQRQIATFVFFFFFFFFFFLLLLLLLSLLILLLLVVLVLTYSSNIVRSLCDLQLDVLLCNSLSRIMCQSLYPHQYVYFFLFSTASPGSSLLSCSSTSASAADTLSKFYSPTGSTSVSAAGYISCSASDQRTAGFPVGCGGYSNYGPVGVASDGLPAYPSYSPYAGSACSSIPGSASSGMDSYLKVRPSPYSVGAEYPAYFSRLHHAGGGNHHQGAISRSSSSSGHVGYEYGSVW